MKEGEAVLNEHCELVIFLIKKRDIYHIIEKTKRRCIRAAVATAKT